MDPISASASMLTILSAAGGSVKFIHSFIISLQDAPSELRAHNAQLDCLHRTIAFLEKVCTELPKDFQLDASLHTHIVNFTREVNLVRAIVEEKNAMMGKGRGYRIRESFRWLLFDRQLKKFFNSLDHWHTIFSQAISASQL